MVDFVKQKYHTIFGFDTSHKISAQAIDIIYWIIIAAAYSYLSNFEVLVADFSFSYVP